MIPKRQDQSDDSNSTSSDAPQQRDSVGKAVRREVFGQRTLFDWFFVLLATTGGWTAATILGGIRSDQRDLQREKVSHMDLLRYSLRVAAENRGEFRMPPYEPPDSRKEDGQK